MRNMFSRSMRSHCLFFLLTGYLVLFFMQSGHAQRTLDFYLEQAEENSTQLYQNRNLIAANLLEGDRLRA